MMAFRLSRRRWLAACGASLGLGFSSNARARSKPVPLLDSKTKQAVQRGLAFLADRQNMDGSFASTPYGRNVAVVALAGMAFMANGNTPGRGSYGEQVERCLNYVLSQATPQGFIVSPEGAVSHGPMYGHGFATLFLAEAYGMAPEYDVRQPLTKAVQVIVQAQGEEGGWRYEPNSRDADLSVTVCQMMALRAARNAGVAAPAMTMQQGVDYVRQCQNEDGGFAYMASQGGSSRFPRSAGALVALNSAGVYDDATVQQGLNYLQKYTVNMGNALRDDYYFYAHYYAVQAMWHAGGARWPAWYESVRDELLSQQKADGSWFDRRICSEYGTAMAVMVLQMPNTYLPIFQR